MREHGHGRCVRSNVIKVGGDEHTRCSCRCSRLRRRLIKTGPKLGRCENVLSLVERTSVYGGERGASDGGNVGLACQRQVGHARQMKGVLALLLATAAAHRHVWRLLRLFSARARLLLLHLHLLGGVELAAACVGVAITLVGAAHRAAWFVRGWAGWLVVVPVCITLAVLAVTVFPTL